MTLSDLLGHLSIASLSNAISHTVVHYLTRFHLTQSHSVMWSFSNSESLVIISLVVQYYDAHNLLFIINHLFSVIPIVFLLYFCILLFTLKLGFNQILETLYSPFSCPWPVHAIQESSSNSLRRASDARSRHTIIDGLSGHGLMTS